MVFALSVFEGIAESVDTGLQKSFERIREEIDSTAETQVKREEKAIDAVNAETQKVMDELRTAQAVLGGVDDPKSAGRAAALLKEAGDLDSFKSLVASIKTYKFNEKGDTYDFTRYFDSQQDIAGVNLTEVAQNYALGRRPPVAQIGAVETKAVALVAYLVLTYQSVHVQRLTHSLHPLACLCQKLQRYHCPALNLSLKHLSWII